MPQNRPPDIIINRKTKEVTYNRRLSDDAKIEFLAPLLARFAMQEPPEQKNQQSESLPDCLKE